MKKQVFFIHGGDAFSKREDFLRYLQTVPVRNLPDTVSKDFWTKSLSTDLGEEYEVFMPSMPNKTNAQYDEWAIWFERHFEYLREDVTLIGWSLGGMFLAKYLSENKLPVEVNKVFLLAAPCGTCADPDGNDCGSFQFDPQSLANLSVDQSKVSIWHSKDDFIVPYDHSLEFKKYLDQAQFVSFEDKNHFLVGELPELIEAINKKA